MDPTIQTLKSLTDKKVTLHFKDGSILDAIILETAHLDEGDDFAVEVIYMHQGGSQHSPWEPDDLLNIHRKHLCSVSKLENNQPTSAFHSIEDSARSE